MKRIFHFIIRETMSVIPAVIFFLITFNLIILSERLMLRHDTPGSLSYTIATISALIMGKLLLIINSLPYVNAFGKKPLIYNILWKFMLYASFVFLFRLADKSTHLWLKYNNKTLVYQHLQEMVTMPTFWAIQIWFLMIFMVYIVACEFVRVLGKDKVKKILFGSEN